MNHHTLGFIYYDDVLILVAHIQRYFFRYKKAVLRLGQIKTDGLARRHSVIFFKRSAAFGQDGALINKILSGVSGQILNNRGKKSLVLDLKAPADLALAHTPAYIADVAQGTLDARAQRVGAGRGIEAAVGLRAPAVPFGAPGGVGVGIGVGSGRGREVVAIRTRARGSVPASRRATRSKSTAAAI